MRLRWWFFPEVDSEQPFSSIKLLVERSFKVLPLWQIWHFHIWMWQRLGNYWQSQSENINIWMGGETKCNDDVGRVRSDSCASCVEIESDYYGDNGAKGPSEKRSSPLCRSHRSHITQIADLTDHRSHKCHKVREAIKKILKISIQSMR